VGRMNGRREGRAHEGPVQGDRIKMWGRISPWRLRAWVGRWQANGELYNLSQA
jgi:hypothetical protein